MGTERINFYCYNLCGINLRSYSQKKLLNLGTPIKRVFDRKERHCMTPIRIVPKWEVKLHGEGWNLTQRYEGRSVIL